MKNKIIGVMMAIVGLTSAVSAQESQNKVLETIANRKSVRSYTDQKVTKEQLTQLLKAGIAAPTAMNRQPWAFIAITDRAILDKLAEKLPYAKMLKSATSAIVVCGDMDKVSEPETDLFWIMDCSAATENILLAAEAIGLGAVWTAVFPDKDRVKIVSNELNLPENIVPLCVIPIGYSDDDSPVKNKWKDENIFWEKWK